MLSKDFVDALTIAIRDGLITPQPEDEAFISKMAGAPEMSQSTKEYWDTQSGCPRTDHLGEGG